MNKLAEDMRENGYEPVAISSSDQEEMDKLKSELSLSFDTISDRENQFRGKLKSDGILDIPCYTDESHPRMTAANFPHGAVQPAIIAFRPGGKVAYRWAITPSKKNLGGATDRPVLEDIWAHVKSGSEPDSSQVRHTGLASMRVDAYAFLPLEKAAKALKAFARRLCPWSKADAKVNDRL